MTIYDSTATTPVADDATATLPEEPVARLSLTRRLAVTWTVVGLTLFVVGLLGFGRLSAAVFGRSALSFDGSTVVLLFVVGGLAILVPHELCHGLAMRAHGSRPRYGAGLVIAAAFSPLVALALGWDALSVTVPVVGWSAFAVELSDVGFAVRPDGSGIAVSGVLVGCGLAILAALARRVRS